MTRYLEHQPFAPESGRPRSSFSVLSSPLRDRKEAPVLLPPDSDLRGHLRSLFTRQLFVLLNGTVANWKKLRKLMRVPFYFNWGKTLSLPSVLLIRNRITPCLLTIPFSFSQGLCQENPPSFREKYASLHSTHPVKENYITTSIQVFFFFFV